MEADEDEDRHSGTSEEAAPLQRRHPQSNEDENLILLLSCDPLTPKPIKDAAVSAAPGPVVAVLSFLNLLSGKRMVRKRRQSPQVVQIGLTED